MYFKVADNRPENKSQLRIGHMTRHRTCVMVYVLGVLKTTAAGVLVRFECTDVVSLDLEVWTSYADFRKVCHSLQLYSVRPDGLMMDVRPTAQLLALRGPALLRPPCPIDDDDPVLELLDAIVPIVGAVGAHAVVPVAAPQPSGVVVQIASTYNISDMG